MHASKRQSIEAQVLHFDQTKEDTGLMLTHEPDKIHQSLQFLRRSFKQPGKCRAEMKEARTDITTAS